VQALRSDVVGCLRQARGGLAFGLLAAAASACVGCGQPRSFLDNSLSMQQSREAERYWGRDGLAGHAPLAYRVPGDPASESRKAGDLVAQMNASHGGSELFPATYRTVPMPHGKPGLATARDATLVAAQPTRDAAPPAAQPAVEPVRPQTLVSAPPSLPVETPKPAEKPTQPATHVTARPRDEGLMMTSLAESESLPPLPAEPTAAQPSDPLPPLPAEHPEPKPATVVKQDSESLPPLPPEVGPQAQPEALPPVEGPESLPPLPDEVP